MAKGKVASAAAPSDSVTVAYLDQRFFNFFAIFGVFAVAALGAEATIHLSHFSRMDSLLEHKGTTVSKLESLKEKLDETKAKVDKTSDDLSTASGKLTLLQASFDARFSSNSAREPLRVADGVAPKPKKKKRRGKRKA